MEIIQSEGERNPVDITFRELLSSHGFNRFHLSDDSEKLMVELYCDGKRRYVADQY